MLYHSTEIDIVSLIYGRKNKNKNYKKNNYRRIFDRFWSNYISVHQYNF